MEKTAVTAPRYVKTAPQPRVVPPDGFGAGAVKPGVAEPGDGTIPPEPDRTLSPAGKRLLAVA